MGDRPVPDTFTASWDRAVAAHGCRPFLVFEDPVGRTAGWTYSEFDGLVDRATARLAEHGAGAGTAVHLALANSVSFVAAWLAAARLGAWIVPSDPASTQPELAEHLARTAPAIGLCSVDRRGPYLAAAAATGLDHVVHVDEAELDPSWLGDAAAPRRMPGVVRPSDRAAVMFTSGTTGRPKGVVVTQANYAFAGEVMAAACALGADDRYLVVLPLFHANAQYYSFAPAIAVGASVALMSSFSASRFLTQAEQHRATCASLFAGPMRMILARSAPLPGAARPQLRHCWFAQNLAPDQYAELASRMGCRPRQLYGMTETIPAVLTEVAADPRPDTMGFATACCAVDVQDHTGRSCAPDEVGEVVVRGEPGHTLFAGYLDDPDTTAASFRDGWFLTGDRAWRDAAGRHHFAGRRSDLLKVAGENVSTVEVEAVLVAHPDLLEAAVVGVPDDVRDEVPHAFVVLAPGIDADGMPEVLSQWCAERLSKAKRPRSIVVVDQLPRTSVGKIRTFLLKEAARS